MRGRMASLFWRVFAVNAGMLVVVAVLLVTATATIGASITSAEALIVMGGLLVTLVVNAVLLHRAVAPLERLAQRMDTVDLLRPGQRLPAGQGDEVGRLVRAFNRMLDRLERERQESGRHVLAAQEAERISIARDLHDEVGQVLTAVLLRLGAITDATPSHRDEIDEAKEAVRRALDEVRRISSELRPEMLEELGLASALTELATTFGRVAGIDVVREFDPSLPRLAPETELATYRIAQQSLTNVARHSDATSVRIVLAGGPDSIVLRVIDDGHGFEGSTPQEHGGLRSMRERALLVGGALAIKQALGGGIEVRLEVPAVSVDARVEAPG